MTAFEAYGYIVLSSVATAAIVWAVCWRYWKPRRLPEHESYIRGYDACSRIKDREEVQLRKDALLSPDIITEWHRKGGDIEVYKNGVRIK